MNKYVNNKLAGVIFSKDRAMQLEGTIESLFLHCGDISRIELCVLYKASSELHGFQYNKLKEEFYNVSFLEEANFKEQLLDVVSGFEYVLFLVDDNLFVRDFHSADIVKSLQQNNDAIGFSLRLGPNTGYCYARDADQSVPGFRQVDNEILKYDWTRAEYDFGYPLEVSSSIYRTADVLGLLKGAQFSNPNTLEGSMASNSHLYRRTRSSLLCFEHSAAFCAPVNMVQTVWDNRVGGDQNYSADKLSQMFENGRRIDVERYSGFVPNSCHQEVELYFKDTGTTLRSSSLRSTSEVAAIIGTPPQGVPKRTYGETAAEAVNAGEYDYEQRNLHRKPLGPLAGVSCGKPKFSIVMANYNNAKYIGQAIESVMNQTFSDWELIIVEDGSTDGSLEIIKRYLGDRRITLIQHQSNRGYTAALKAGIANVRSDYFGILDSDDCLVPRAVETMYNWHVELPDRGLIYSQFAFCGEDLTQKKIGFCAEIAPGRTTLDANVVSHFKTFKMRDYLKTSGYDENILYAEDIDIVYKMEEVSGLKFVSDCLYLYRELSSSLCHSPNKINVSIMSRVKARINALKRRCGVSAEQGNQSFDELFRRAVAEARKKYEDVEQYFIILTKLCENGMLTDVNWPDGADKWELEDTVLWLAANVDVQFDKLFELIGRRKAVNGRPLVTVKMVTYNAEKFIRQAIESVLAQTYRNFELLIIDDGSTDATAQLIASYSDSRIRYIHTPHKNGAIAANRAITEAESDCILRVDSDDFIEPSYVEKIVACAQQHPEIDFFYPSRLALVDAAGNPTGEHWSYPDFSDNSTLPAFLFDKGYGPIPNPGSLKRRTLYNRVGVYDDVDSVEDFVFLCRNALRIRFMRVDDHSTYFYRRLPTSNSHNYEARNQIMARMLNEMVSIYPPEVLCPKIAGISDAVVKEQQYCQYLMRTFYRHAGGDMVQYSEYFERYGDYYKQKLSQITSPGKPVGSAEAL